MVAPAFAGEPERSVYLPAGDWFDFWTEKRYAGRQRIRVAPPIEQIPMYVRADTILPLAMPTLQTGNPVSWGLEMRVYGAHPSPATLFEDDGGWNPTLTELWMEYGPQRGENRLVGPNGVARRYNIVAVKVIGS